MLCKGIFFLCAHSTPIYVLVIMTRSFIYISTLDQQTFNHYRTLLCSIYLQLQLYYIIAWTVTMIRQRQNYRYDIFDLKVFNGDTKEKNVWYFQLFFRTNFYYVLFMYGNRKRQICFLCLISTKWLIKFWIQCLNTFNPI